MDADNSSYDWSSDDGAQPQPGDHAGLAEPSQQAAGRSQLRPARKTLPFVPYTDWDPTQSYDDQPLTCIRYVMEWKVTFNNRKVRMQTEEALVVAPGDFWDENLLPQVTEIATTTSKPSKPDATTIVMTVNDRSESDITKSFKELQIDWSIAEKQLKTWSHLLRIGKRLKLSVCFKYVESKTAGPVGRGATVAMLGENQTRLEASQAVLGRPEAYPHVFRTFRCPGPPCDRGPYCWQDPVDKKRYKLLGHHLRALVNVVQGGGVLETHDDVPEDVRTQLRTEGEQDASRKRKRRGSVSAPTGQPPISSTTTFQRLLLLPRSPSGTLT